MAKKTEESNVIEIKPVEMESIVVPIVGVTPFICSAMSQKVRFELLMPGNRNKAEQRATLKHDPLQEFRDSAYTAEDDDDYPTRILTLPTAFKRAMAQAAIDVPGNAAKAQIGRLTYVKGQYVALYGTPEMCMHITRNSDQKKTPDVRTRIIIPNWACLLEIQYMRPVLNKQTVVNLLSAAGQIVGVGDWRQEKGSGNYGLFRVASPEDPEFLQIIKIGRKAQDAALANPVFHDKETKELFSMFNAALVVKGEKTVQEKPKKGAKG